MKREFRKIKPREEMDISSSLECFLSFLAGFEDQKFSEVPRLARLAFYVFQKFQTYSLAFDKCGLWSKALPFICDCKVYRCANESYTCREEEKDLLALVAYFVGNYLRTQVSNTVPRQYPPEVLLLYF